MDINLFVLNLGNTRLAVGVFAAGELKYVRRVGLDQEADWPAVLAEAWAALPAGESDVAGASTNPPVEAAVARAVETATGRAVRWVGRDLDLPIPVRTENPAATGVDRVLNVAAAYEQMGKACVVVDAGSAVTVDLCGEKGELLGGAIAAGAQMQLDALHAHTASLPQLTFAAPDPAVLVPRGTDLAMQAGVYHGLRGLVKELAESYALDLGTWPEIIATGGDAAALFGGWELIHAVSPDLTLYGIALAFAEHEIKHGK